MPGASTPLLRRGRELRCSTHRSRPAEPLSRIVTFRRLLPSGARLQTVARRPADLDRKRRTPKVCSISAMACPATGGAERVISIADQQDALSGHDGEDKLGQDSIFIDKDLKPIFHVVSRSDVDRTRPRPRVLSKKAASTSAAGRYVATKPP